MRGTAGIMTGRSSCGVRLKEAPRDEMLARNIAASRSTSTRKLHRESRPPFTLIHSSRSHDCEQNQTPFWQPRGYSRVSLHGTVAFPQSDRTGLLDRPRRHSSGVICAANAPVAKSSSGSVLFDVNALLLRQHAKAMPWREAEVEAYVGSPG